MKGGLRAALAIAALGAGLGMAPGGLGMGMPAGVVKTVGSPRAERRQERRPNPGDVSHYLRKTGWTNARYQRAARKRRNCIKNRRAHRG